MSIRLSKLPEATVTDDDIVIIGQLSTTVTYTATTISAQASDNSLNDSASQFVAEGFVAGHSIKIAGFTGDTGNNHFTAVILSVTAGKIVLKDEFPLVDDAAGESVTLTRWTTGRTTVAEINARGGGGDASTVTYTPGDTGDWGSNTDPGDVDEALDQLAARVTTVEVGGGGGGGDAADITYTPTTLADWDGSADPGDVDAALDQLAARVTDVEGAAGGYGKQAIPVMAAQMTPRATNGCASLAYLSMGTDKPDAQYLAFDASTTEYAEFAFIMPSSWNESTITFKPVWTHPATSTNFGVVFALQAVAVGDDDSLNTTFGTAQNSADTGGTTSDLYTGPESSAITVAGTPAAGDTVFFRLARLP